MQSDLLYEVVMSVKLFINKMPLAALLFFALLSVELGSQNTAESGQGTVLYVNTKSGLILRKEADKKSQKLDLMPYGQKVISEQSFIPAGSADSAGGWVNVHYSGKEGYAAGEFLSFIDPKKAVSSHWKCRTLYNYNPGKETYTGELVLFKDSTYLTVTNTEGRSISDKGTYSQTGNRISFKSKMDQTPEELIIIKKYLIESKDKKLLDKDPNLISRLEKIWKSMLDGDEKDAESEESKKMMMNLCSPMK